MRGTKRVGHRIRLGLVSALSLALVSAPLFTASASAAEEEGTKNLSTPVILVDDSTMSAAFSVPTGTSTELPFVEGNADYTNTTGDYYTGVGSDTYESTVDQDFDADLWGAEYIEELVNPVVADVKWGDNLISHAFPGSGSQPIRVEVNLFADQTAATMQGYETVSLEGEHMDELFGTLGNATDLLPMVYTPHATLTILQYEETTGLYSHEIYDGYMSAEVNGSGKLIYGFNWGTPNGLSNPGQGNYRLIFTVADESLVIFDEALHGDDAETEEPMHMPMIASEKISYIDIAMGDDLLDPPLPFVVAGEDRDLDFDNDGNADVVARHTDGTLYLFKGNGATGFLGRVKIGTGWNNMTAITSPGDFDNDGNADVVARHTDGTLYLFKGNGATGFTAKVKIGTGWNIMTMILS